MAESTLGVTEASSPGKFLHTWSRSIGSTTREETAVYMAAHPIATYTATAVGVRANTANSHLMFLQGDGTNYGRIHRITVNPANIIATASTLAIQVLRTSTAGSSGTAVNARAFDAADTTPYAGTIQTLPSSKGSEGDVILFRRVQLAASNPLSLGFEWKEADQAKPIIFGNGTANGIAIKNLAAASVEMDVEVEFSVTSYL